MTDYRRLYDSEYIASWDLEKDTTLTVAKVVGGEVGGQQGRPVTKKPIVYFQEAKKPMILNKTNGKTIAAMYGKDTEQWVGKKITLYVGQCDVAGETMDCLRIRPGVPK